MNSNNRFFSIFISFCSLAFAVFYSYAAAGSVIEVGANQEIHTISEAIGLASPGDSIHLRAGRYAEHDLIIAKKLTIYGEARAIIDGQDQSENLIVVAADSVVISGIEFRNVGVSFLTENAAIRVVGCQHVRILNNRIDSCFFGVYLENAKYASVSNNVIIGDVKDEASAGNAIHAWKCDHLNISNNHVEQHRDGIYFEFVNHSEIIGNKSRSNLRYGLHFMFSNDDVYRKNLFEENGAGVAVMFSRRIKMLENTFINNWGGASYGLLLKEISDGSIEGNLFRKNTIGILAEGANRLEISKNSFYQNGTALDVKGNCLDNHFSQNNFIANTFEVVTNSRHNNNAFDENYWSSYNGYDMDKDGYGDVPFRPVNLFAKIAHEVPAATFLLQSPFVGLLEMGEKLFPQFIPETLVDESPKLRPYLYDQH